MSETTTLCPAQQRAFDGLMAGLPAGNVFVLGGDTGRGKTTVLNAVHDALGGPFLTMKEFMDALRRGHPFALEETFERLVMDALAQSDTVIVDDLHVLTSVVLPCGFAIYPRRNLLRAPLTTLAAYASAANKKLIFGCSGDVPGAVRERAFLHAVDLFTPDDYRFLCDAFLGPERAATLDTAKIHRFAPKLNAHQLRGACAWLRGSAAETFDTDTFIEYLRSQKMASNVQLSEVRAVDLHTLKGVDDVLEALEANLVLPLENDALSSELGIKPKRGVLLAGPPGTGKTTIGRALAHRLKSKFFLVDGTFISGTSNFYEKIQQVFEAAKENAPSILFIDDSDVIFESGEEMGLYRYLLTMLDGLESESAGRVCVMMTAMDVGNLPPALIRSGRIELWLETRLPDETARRAILADLAGALPPALGDIDLDEIAGATDGLTGADLRRLIDDGKLLFAYDRVREKALQPVTAYFLRAVETVRSNKERYAEAEARARAQHPRRPSYFDMLGMMGSVGSGGNGTDEDA